MLPLVLVLLTLPLGRPLDAVDHAAAMARVGDGTGAIAALRDWKARPEDAAPIALIRARAYLAQGQLEFARLALATYRQTPGPKARLDAVAAHLALEAQWLRPPWDPARPQAVIAAADALLAHPDLPPQWTTRARIRAAQVEAVVPSLEARAAERLRGLDDPRALDLLAGLSDAPTRARLERRIVVEHPASRAGRARAEQAAALGLADQVARARRLFAARAYDLAEPAWAAVGRLASDDALREEAALIRGTIMLRLFQDPAVAAGLLAGAARSRDAGRAAEALFRQGIALGRMARWDQAIVAMKAAVARQPRGPFATGAGYQVGRLMHEAGRFRQAAAQHARFLRKRPGDQAKYTWFLGWSWYRAKAWKKARAVFERLSGDENLLVGAKALYWIARSHVEEARPKAALKALATLRQRAPWGYYGLLGDTLARQLDPTWPPLERPAALRAPAQVPDLTRWAGELGERLPLIRAGYPALATDPSLREPAFEATWRHATERFGVHWRAHADRRLPWREGLERNSPTAARLAYPAAWLALATAAGRPHGVSPWWLLSHMLQESRFKARARSHAGALGPMQVLPRTGLRIAARLGLPRGDFGPDQLFEPGIALRHAAWYLAALRAEFDGSLLLAIAAYNGGPLRFAAHTRAARDLPFDVMIEEIGAHESRNYVRKVADHLIRFAVLYADDAELAQLLDALRPPARIPQARGEVLF